MIVRPTRAKKVKWVKEKEDIWIISSENNVLNNQAHAFSCRRQDPTASSVLDQGELGMISPAGLAPFGYVAFER